MNEYNFLAVHKVPADLICSICNKLIFDARISPCGCRYCKVCIEEHLSNGSDICPSKKRECEEEKLELDTNIWIDQVANRRVAKLIVWCPIKMCKYQDTITKVHEHVEICKKQSIKCKYYEFGCDYNNASGDDIKNHMESDKDRHINQLMIRIGEKEEENKNLRNEIVRLEKDLGAKQIQIAEVEKQMEKLKIDYNKKLETNSELNQTKRNLEEKQKKIDDLRMKLICFFSANAKEFVWVIDSFEKKFESNSNLYSDEFYTHTDGYKMQLEIFKRRYENLLVAKMIDGIYNRNQHFPVTIDLTIGFVNTRTNEYLKSERQIVQFDDTYSKSSPWKLYTFEIEDLSLIIKCVAKIVK